jgi:hypothetical protein
MTYALKDVLNYLHDNAVSDARISGEQIVIPACEGLDGKMVVTVSGNTITAQTEKYGTTTVATPAALVELIYEL